MRCVKLWFKKETPGPRTMLLKVSCETANLWVGTQVLQFGQSMFESGQQVIDKTAVDKFKEVTWHDSKK